MHRLIMDRMQEDPELNYFYQMDPKFRNFVDELYGADTEDEEENVTINFITSLLRSYNSLASKILLDRLDWNREK